MLQKIYGKTPETLNDMLIDTNWKLIDQWYTYMGRVLGPMKIPSVFQTNKLGPTQTAMKVDPVLAQCSDDSTDIKPMLEQPSLLSGQYCPIEFCYLVMFYLSGKQGPNFNIQFISMHFLAKYIFDRADSCINIFSVFYTLLIFLNSVITL